MRLTSIDQPCPYLAISYAWGEIQEDGSHLSKSVICDDQVILITKSVCSGLQRVRQYWPTGALSLPGPFLVVWADAICIDQNNRAERSQQVELMDKIFAKCSKLIVWLGDHDNQHAKAAYKLFESLATEQENPTGSSFSCVLAAVEQILESDRIEQGKTHSQPWEVIKAFFAKRWFQRRWVLQELYHAYGATSDRNIFEHQQTTQSPCVLFSNYAMPFLRLQSAVKLLERLRPHFGKGKLDFDLPAPFHDQIITTRFDRSKPLTMLQTVDSMVCSDDRDRIYCLLSMFGSFCMSVDYNKTVEEVYTDFAVCCLRKSTCMGQLLACAVARRSLDTIVHLPSWVADWRSAANYQSVKHKQVAQDPHFKSIGYDPPRPGGRENILSIEGRLLRPKCILNLLSEAKAHHQDDKTLEDSAYCDCAPRAAYASRVGNYKSLRQTWETMRSDQSILVLGENRQPYESLGDDNTVTFMVEAVDSAQGTLYTLESFFVIGFKYGGKDDGILRDDDQFEKLCPLEMIGLV